jgi:hypothetical protein
MIQTCWPVRLSEISLRQVIQQSLKRSTVTRSMITEGRTRPVLQHHNHEAHHTRACIHTQHGIAAISGAKTNTVHRFPNISHGRSDTQQGPSHIQDLCIDGRVLIASTGQQLDLRWVPGWRVGAPIVWGHSSPLAQGQVPGSCDFAGHSIARCRSQVHIVPGRLRKHGLQVRFCLLYALTTRQAPACQAVDVRPQERRHSARLSLSEISQKHCARLAKRYSPDETALSI